MGVYKVQPDDLVPYQDSRGVEQNTSFSEPECTRGEGISGIYNPRGETGAGRYDLALSPIGGLGDTELKG